MFFFWFFSCIIENQLAISGLKNSSFSGRMEHLTRSSTCRWVRARLASEVFFSFKKKRKKEKKLRILSLTKNNRGTSVLCSQLQYLALLTACFALAIVIVSNISFPIFKVLLTTAWRVGRPIRPFILAPHRRLKFNLRASIDPSYPLLGLKSEPFITEMDGLDLYYKACRVGRPTESLGAL